MRDISKKRVEIASEWAFKNEQHPISIWLFNVIARCDDCREAYQSLLEIAPNKKAAIQKLTWDQAEDAYDCRDSIYRIILTALKNGKLK